MLSVSISVSSYTPFLVNLGGLVLLVFSIPSGSYKVSISSSTGSLSIERRDLMVSSNVDSLCLMSGHFCFSSYVLQEETSLVMTE